MQHTCRFCATPLSNEVADLGSTPFSNSFLASEDAIKSETSFPLKVMVCSECFLVQTTETVSPAAIFNAEYAYLSSFSTSWLEHAKSYAKMACERFALGPQSTVVEVASNDGYLLQYFKEDGINVLGVEPAGNAAKIAETKGVTTKVAFFGAQTARDIVDSGIQADLTAANNVLAHVPDIADFLNGFAIVLKPQGVATFEFPHLLRMFEECQFDTIYHEHYSYISLLAAEHIFTSCGLSIFDVEELATHGGSLRIFAQKTGAGRPETERLHAMREKERQFGLENFTVYRQFGASVAAICDDFRKFLATAKENGKKVAAYGAAAKGNTFLNVCGIKREDISFVVDRSNIKQGTLLPGSHIPVYAPEELATAKPDYLVILPWNLTKEIVDSNTHIREWGGQFIRAIPKLEIL